MGLTAPAPALAGFADEVGGEGPVAVEGGRTQWEVGGGPAAEARLLRAPSGVLSVEPAEMTVRVLAGTPVADLQAALAEVGQCVNLPGDLEGLGGATVGGVLAVGRSGLRRLGWGPLRDALLQVRYVSAEGLIVTGGGPTVKNVTGFDLPRLLIGSLGTLGLLGEVILRTRPSPPLERWLAGPADPFALRDHLFRPTALLWDGTTTWLLLSGYEADVEAETAAALAVAPGLTEAAGPPSPLPWGRRSLRPRQLRELAAASPGGRFVAEVGVGVVHVEGPDEPAPLEPAVALLHHRLKTAFDPRARLNPGRDPLLG